MTNRQNENCCKPALNLDERVNCSHKTAGCQNEARREEEAQRGVTGLCPYQRLCEPAQGPGSPQALECLRGKPSILRLLKIRRFWPCTGCLHRCSSHAEVFRSQGELRQRHRSFRHVSGIRSKLLESYCEVCICQNRVGLLPAPPPENWTRAFYGIILELFQIRRFGLRTASRRFFPGRFPRLRRRCFRQIPLSPRVWTIALAYPRSPTETQEYIRPSKLAGRRQRS